MSATTFTGRVTQEPELKFGKSGKAFLSLNTAENHRRKNQQSGEWEDSGTTWRRVTVFDAHAENIADQVRKGSLVLVVGRQETREYEKQDGSKGSSLEVLADEVGVLIPKWAPKNESPAHSQPAPQADPWNGNYGGGWETPNQGEVPF